MWSDNPLFAFFSVYPEYMGRWLPALVSASGTALTITIGSFAIACALGLAVAGLRLSRNKLLSRLAMIYIELFRSIPTLVLLFMLYYGIVPLGIVFDPLPAAILALGMAGSAHMAEILRAGVQAIPKSQREAALAAGLTPLQSFRLIIFPQVLRISLPPSINMLIVLLKDSSLASLISAPEIMQTAKQIMSRDYMPLHILLVAGLIYLVLGLLLSLLANLVDQRFTAGRGRQ